MPHLEENEVREVENTTTKTIFVLLTDLFLQVMDGCSR